MPYVPPSSASPSPTATSPVSPAASDTAAGTAGRRHGRHSSESAMIFQRPSSSSYLHRHRRSPSVCAPVSTLQQTPDIWTASRGIVLSPPESRNNSGDEEDGRRQQKAKEMLDGLKEAMISIDKLAHKHNNSYHHQQHHQQQQPKRNEEESASSGNGGIVLYSLPEQATQTPDQSDQDEDEPAKKPPMLRKKSGELVRPAIRLRQGRPLSVPGTPTFSKVVHFGAQLEEVRHFMQLDKPLAVSAGSSPVEDYDGDTEFPFPISTASSSIKEKDNWEARVTNFPSILNDARLNMPVRLCRISLCPTTYALRGTVAVANLAYTKRVSARFTLNNWKTVSEVIATFVPPGQSGVDHEEREGFDTFSFSIELSDHLRHGIENKTLFLCLRYKVGGTELWDNNDDMNYQVVFSRRSATSGTSNGSAKDPLYRMRMARAGRPKMRPRPLSMVTMSVGMDVSVKETQFEFPTAEHHDVVDVDVDSEKEGWFPGPDSPTRRNKIRTNAFGDRYDFSTSLSSVRPQTFRDTTQQGCIQGEGNSDSDETAAANEKKISDFMSDKPNHKSQVYKELVDRYCFFGSTKGCNQQPKSAMGTLCVSTKDGADLDLEVEADVDSSSTASPDHPSTPTMQMRMRLPRRLSPTPPQHTSGSASTSASASTSDTEGVATPSPSAGILPFPFRRERGLTPSPTPTAILG